MGLLSLAHMMIFVDQFAISAVAGQLKRALRLSETELGALEGLAVALPYAAAVLPLGWLADRIPPRRLIIAGIAAWAAGAFACAFGASLVQFWAARLLIGIGHAAFVPAALAFLGRSFRGGALARPVSVFTAGATLGKSVALLASGLILRLDLSTPGLHALFGGATWREVFVFTAVPNLLLILAFGLVRAEAWGPAPAPAAQRTLERGGLVLGPGFLTFALIALAPLILIQAAAAWTPLFYVRTFHLAASHAAFLVGGVVIFAAPLGHLAGGQLTAFALRKGLQPGLLVAACLAAAAPLGAAFCLVPSLPLSLTAYGSAVVVLGIAAPAGLTGISLMAPPRRLAAANAAYLAVATLAGVGFGPAIVGMMSDALFGGAGGLRTSLATLFLSVPPAAVAIALTCRGLWRTGEPAEPVRPVCSPQGAASR